MVSWSLSLSHHLQLSEGSLGSFMILILHVATKSIFCGVFLFDQGTPGVSCMGPDVSVSMLLM